MTDTAISSTDIGSPGTVDNFQIFFSKFGIELAKLEGQIFNWANLKSPDFEHFFSLNLNCSTIVTDTALLSTDLRSPGAVDNFQKKNSKFGPELAKLEGQIWDLVNLKSPNFKCFSTLNLNSSKTTTD